MDTSKIDFEISTLKKIKEFQEGIVSFQENYPDLSFKKIREYLSTGDRQAEIPEELYEKIDKLEELRESAIRTEMKHAVAKARLSNKEIPEKFATGKALTPMFGNDIYKFSSSFAVYDYFRWYSDEEVAKLIDEPSKEEEELEL